jgi:hypothetical protein
VRASFKVEFGSGAVIALQLASEGRAVDSGHAIMILCAKSGLRPAFFSLMSPPSPDQVRDQWKLSHVVCSSHRCFV